MGLRGGVRTFETVVIGGGVSGLACANRLHELERDFVLFDPRPGGRMRAGPTNANLGASYVTADYRNLGRFVLRGERARPRNVGCLVDGVPITVPEYSRRHPGPTARLLSHLRTVRRRHNRMRRQMARVSQYDLLQRDPFLKELVETPAEAWIAANDLEPMNRDVLGPFARSTAFVTPSELDAFTWSLCQYPYVVRAWTADFRGAVDRFTRGWMDRLREFPVTRLDRSDALWRVGAGDEEVLAHNIVVATTDTATRLYAPRFAGHSRQVPVRTLHVRGRRRKPLDAIPLIFLPEPHRLTVLWEQPDGVDVLFDLGGADLDRYYEEVDVVAECQWEPGIQLAGNAWRRLRPEPGVFTIGDHNLCGMEDSFLTGAFAANCIAGVVE